MKHQGIKRQKIKKPSNICVDETLCKQASKKVGILVFFLWPKTIYFVFKWATENVDPSKESWESSLSRMFIRFLIVPIFIQNYKDFEKWCRTLESHPDITS